MAKPTWNDLRDEIARSFWDQGIEVDFRVVSNAFDNPSRPPKGVATRFRNSTGTMTKTIWADDDGVNNPLRDPNLYTYDPWEIAAAFNEVGFKPSPAYLQHFGVVIPDPNPEPPAPAPDPFQSEEFTQSWDLSSQTDPFADAGIVWDPDAEKWTIEERGGEGKAGR